MSTSRNDVIEERRQAIQETLDAANSSAERNRLGQFATPNALAVEIARFVASLVDEKTRDIRFADPALGTGSFYSAALSAFGAHGFHSAVGIEVDPAFADAAASLWHDEGLRVIQGDFTRVAADSARPPAPNLVLANPPYVRHHHLDRADKERLQSLTYRMTGVEVSGLAGLYVYFLLLATAWMEDEGYAAWLIPSEFMDVNYGAALKRFLLDRVTLLRVHRFDPDDVQFGDALVSSVVVVFKKASPLPGHKPEFTFGGSITCPCAEERVAAKLLREARKWTAFPSHAGNDRHGNGNGDAPTLADFFHIQRGIATGGNKFFVLERTEAKRRGLPERYLRPVLPSPRYLKTTVIEADESGYPLIDPPLCLIDCDLPEHVVRESHPGLWKYLQSASDAGIREGYLVGKRNPWYRQEQRAAAPFLCTYMGRGANGKSPFRFILNRSLAICTNLYLMLRPRNGLATMLQNHPERDADVYNVLCGITAHELRGEGRVYGGGLNKIEPKELGRVSASSLILQWPEIESAAVTNRQRSLSL